MKLVSPSQRGKVRLALAVNRYHSFQPKSPYRIKVEGFAVGVAAERSPEGRHQGPASRIGVAGRVERDGHFEDARDPVPRSMGPEHASRARELRKSG